MGGMDYTTDVSADITSLQSPPTVSVGCIHCVVSGLVQTHLYKPSIYELHEQISTCINLSSCESLTNVVKVSYCTNVRLVTLATRTPRNKCCFSKWGEPERAPH